jgi:uncharacterized protein (TIGR03083 family)
MGAMTLNWLSIFDTEHEAFIASCERASVGAPVPTCPGWSVGDLLYHLYEVQYLWHRVSAEARSGFDGLSMPVRPSDEALVDVLRGEHVSYTAWLRANAPETPQWTWTGMQDFQWLSRRMAHEAAMHRVDADLARGAVGAIEPELASDGIDEFLEFFRNGELNGSVHIHCTDVAGEWTIDRDGTVRREHAKGDCAIRGAASDILLALWRRGSLEVCDVVGDAAVAAHFIAASNLD